MELIFAYIRKQGVLENIGLNFSPYYKVSYDNESRTLNIEETKNFPKDFFNDPIISITGIVGNNGAGKSTAIYWLLRALVDGSGETEPDGIIVLKEDRGNRFTVYTGEEFRGIDIKHSFIKGDIKRIEGRFKSHLPCCYFSGHFSPFIQLDIDSGELTGETNISDKWLLIKDYQNFTAEDGLHLQHPLFHYLNAHVIQDAYRITQFLMDRSNREKFEEENLMQLPKYIIISPNKAGRTKLNRINKSEKDSQIPINYSEEILHSHIKYPNDPEQELINSFVIESFINYIAENLLGSEETIKQFWKWVNYPANNDALQDLSTFIIETKNKDDFFLSNLLNTLQILQHLATIGIHLQKPFFYLTVEESDKLRSFSEDLLLSSIFLTCRFFDLSYTIDLHSLTKLSSGERAMLNLLSRLYWYLTIEVPGISNLDVPAMLFLDEAEIGFHPDWQRKYLWVLNEFLRIFFQNNIYNERDLPRKIQIVYTTHSPITLADLPKECINSLEKVGDRVYNRADTMPQTFGENIFELYRHSFFMRDGLLGRMAEEYIKSILDILEGGLKDQENRTFPPNELQKRIGIVGDRRIRNYLLQKYSKTIDANDLESQIALKKMELKALEQLKKQQNGHEEN
ncbi:MAG: AAA family ATPase [Muribaculaceae bacterium]|nr:AAA family ATPase [Muribaculaceae bacterium]